METIEQQSVPGTVVPQGALVSPGGATGGTGPTGPTGQTGPTGPQAVSTDANNIAVLGSDSRIYVPDQTAKITSVRLRSFNALGNPTMEVDCRNAGNTVVVAAGTQSPFICDRWQLNKNAATGTLAATQSAISGAFGWPGFAGSNVTSKNFYFNPQTTQATLAANEFLAIQQTVEGPNLRELLGGTHSISFMAFCQQAISLAVSLVGGASNYSYVSSLLSLPAGVWTLFTIPNIPIWTSSTTWSTAPGTSGYIFRICLGTSSTYQTGTTGSWISGNWLAPAGVTNFLSLPSGTGFYLTALQHEPGAPTTFIDQPFYKNYQECLRYYTKSFSYGQAVSNYTSAGEIFYPMPQATLALGYTGYPVTMAKAPSTVNIYNSTAPGSAAGTVAEYPGGTVRTGCTAASSSDRGLSYLNVPSGVAGQSVRFHYTADTGF